MWRTLSSTVNHSLALPFLVLLPLKAGVLPMYTSENFYQPDYAPNLCCSWMMIPLNCQESMGDEIPCSWLLVIQEAAKGWAWVEENTARKKNVRIR